MKKTNILLVLAIALCLCSPTLVHIAKAAYKADLNGDGQINATDLTILKTDFLKLAANLTNPKSDIDADGQVTIKDLGIMMSTWGTVPVPPPTSTAFSTYILANPVSDSQILPTSDISSSPSGAISIFAAKDQYQSASFVVRAGSSDVTSLLATPSALTSGSNTIPASAVDIRTVKAWYQSGAADSLNRQSGRYLTPELLLHNDNLIRVDLTGQNNYLKLSSGGELNISSDTQASPDQIQPTDTAALQSLTLSANQNKQYWITLHVPANAAAGTYTGTIDLTSANGGSQTINVTVTVPNWALEQSNLLYGMYYSGYTNTGYPSGTISDSIKSPTQYTAELQDMLQHGVKYPNMAVDIYDSRSGTTDFKTRASIGFPKDILFIGGEGWLSHISVTSSMPSNYQTMLQDYLSAAKNNGFNNVATFGIDEVGDLQTLQNEYAAFDLIHQLGMKTLMTTWADANPYTISGLTGKIDYVDYNYTNVPYQSIDASQAAPWHAAGDKVLKYGPQSVLELPRANRQMFGWAVAKANYDGAFMYVYQDVQAPTWGTGLIWNDFSTTVGHYRNHVYAYPTTNGAVDTLQYEGLREGINDMRYLATLQKAIKDHPGTTATAAQNWLNSVDPNGDLDAVRKTMADYITQLVL